MIGLSNRDRVLVRPGDQAVYKRSNFGSPVGESTALALNLSGPSNGEEDVESGEFVVSASGSLGSANRTVTISKAGIDGSLSVSSLVLSDATPNGTFTFTPTVDGVATITVSSPGLISASVNYTAITPTPEPNMDLWVAWVNPAWEFGTTRPNNGYGQQHTPAVQMEFDGSPARNSPSNVALHKLGSQIAWEPSASVVITANEVQIGAVTPTHALVKRQQVNGKWRFLFTLDKIEQWWSATEKWRTKLHNSDENDTSPAGTEMWCALSLKFTDADLKASPGGYNIAAETHGGDGGLIKGGALEVWTEGGNGNAAAAYIKAKLIWYHGVNGEWPPAGSTLNDNRYFSEEYHTIVPGPIQTGIDHYLIFNWRMLHGFSDPVFGPIYGPLDTSQGFLRIWHAAGDSASPAQVLDYVGPLGTPQDPATVKAADIENGTYKYDEQIKIGIYSRTDMKPTSAGTQRTCDTRGIKAWRQQYGSAGQRLIDQHDVLAAFKAGP